MIGQANNALVFPGLGLGAVVARASRMTDRMIFAAAEAVAGLVDATNPGASLLPQINDVRETSVAVAMAVAQAAAADGVARAPPRTRPRSPGPPLHVGTRPTARSARPDRREPVEPRLGRRSARSARKARSAALAARLERGS